MTTATLPPPPRSKTKPGHETRSKGGNSSKGQVQTPKYQILPPPTPST